MVGPEPTRTTAVVPAADPLVYMVTTYVVLDPMYVDVVSCSSGHFSSCGTLWLGYDTLYLRTYVPAITRAYTEHARYS